MPLRIVGVPTQSMQTRILRGIPLLSLEGPSSSEPILWTSKALIPDYYLCAAFFAFLGSKLAKEGNSGFCL